MSDRIFVVGHAAVTCLGRDMDATWRGLIEGRSGIRRHAALGTESFLQDLGGMVEDFGPGTESEDPAIAKLSARFLHLGMAAARSAWSESGLAGPESGLDPHRAAVVMGSAFGGLDLLEAEQARMARRRSPAISPYLVPAMIINQAAGQVAQHLGLYGPSAAPANACASGGHCGGPGGDVPPLGRGRRRPLRGRGERVHAGDRQRLRDDEGPAGQEAGRPVGAGPGAGQPAVQRRPGGLRPGRGSRGPGPGHRVGRRPSGARAPRPSWSPGPPIPTATTWPCPAATGSSAAWRRRWSAAAYPPRTSTITTPTAPARSSTTRSRPRSSRTSSARPLGRLPVSSIKGALGHSLGAASAIEAAVSVRALRDQIIPPTINYRPDPELDLDYVPDQARAARLEHVLSASFGFGGTNNALILRRMSA